ncbi:olfactory receptor 52E4-like [Conger conger]|uniref:olfactory receptor 52E4-like n=1 Tax=Conger conger TaxID=82655 RepID=UPI002A59D49E|nr:olfactory receptor 52E4-like [Conger conger]
MSPLNSNGFINTTIVHPDFFFISGLIGIPHTNYYYIFLGFVYAVTVLGNTFVMFIIYTDHCLHSPKYTVILNLAVSDLCVSTAVIPLLIDTLLFKSHLISFRACLTDMFFVYLFYAMQSLTLTLLSYDRCAAICFPLRYNEIVTNKSMLLILTVIWMLAGSAAVVAATLLSRLSFCKSTVIDSYFCDHEPTYRLACNDNSPSVVIRWTYPVLSLWFPLVFITGTYVCIARALLKIAAVSERLKAMKTCTSHLILVSVFYLPLCFSFALGPSIHQNARIINVSLATVLPPALNPIIYTLKTEEFTESIRKLYRRKKMRTIVRKK